MEPYIPYEISNLAIQYSIPLFITAGLISVICGQRILGLIQFSVYVTSVLYWSHIEKNGGFYRYLDMTCAIACVLWCTYVATYCIPNICYVWYRCLCIIIAFFCVNEFVFFISMDYFIDEKWRTYIMYQSVITHMIFMHVLPILTGIYCVVMGKPNTIKKEDKTEDKIKKMIS
jgi:hypothetical protein